MEKILTLDKLDNREPLFNSYEETLNEWKDRLIAEDSSFNGFQSLIKILNRYEKSAGEEGYLNDWHLEIMETIKIYFFKCDLNNTKSTIEELKLTIDNKAKLFFG